MEDWKDIKNYEGLYQISKKGEVYSFYSDKILKQSNCGGGYLGVSLVKNKIKSTTQIHRVVAETFLENKDVLPAVNHIDGDKWNNRLSNLEWVTYKENTSHAIKTGLMKQGKEHPMYGKKHSDETKEKMREMKLGKEGRLHPRSTEIAKTCLDSGYILETYESQHIASRENNISQGNINMVLNNKRSHAGGYGWIYL